MHGYIFFFWNPSRTEIVTFSWGQKRFDYSGTCDYSGCDYLEALKYFKIIFKVSSSNFNIFPLGGEKDLLGTIISEAKPPWSHHGIDIEREPPNVSVQKSIKILFSTYYILNRNFLFYICESSKKIMQAKSRDSDFWRSRVFCPVLPVLYSEIVQDGF